MPMYEYLCKDCGEQFDLLRGMNQDDSDITCKKCGSPKVERKLSVFASVNKEGGSSASDDLGSCSTGMCGCGPTCGF